MSDSTSVSVFKFEDVYARLQSTQTVCSVGIISAADLKGLMKLIAIIKTQVSKQVDRYKEQEKALGKLAFLLDPPRLVCATFQPSSSFGSYFHLKAGYSEYRGAVTRISYTEDSGYLPYRDIPERGKVVNPFPEDCRVTLGVPYGYSFGHFLSAIKNRVSWDSLLLSQEENQLAVVFGISREELIRLSDTKD